ncbi:hypothetical protein ABZ371_23760 [Streptomyces sp. NPDC005899]|uniref:hypothetical protein n=1 Tax=Streptomyces sp. NPDC005899 TaxID=3155716 RepID=UPI0034022215
MRPIKIATGLGIAALTTGMLLGLPATSAQAVEYPTTPGINVPFGATYTQGTATWYNRSVTLAGEHRAISSSGCRATWMYTYDANGKQLGSRGTSIICEQTAGFTLNVPADVPGGAATIKVCLDDGNYVDLACKTYRRP